MSRVIGLDWETTKLPHIFPWQKEAYAVSLCLVDETGWKRTWIFSHNEDFPPRPHQEMIDEINAELLTATRIVGHNLKFDINWCREMGVKTEHLKVWCTQLTEYLIEGHRYLPYSLAEVSKRRGIPDKIDKVKMFWEAGYETCEIPLDILVPYGEQDSYNTLAIYQQQVKDVNEMGLGAVVSIEMEKMRMLSEIECTGMYVDKKLAEKYVSEYESKLEEIDEEIFSLSGDRKYNLSSNDDLSVMLYGGTLKTDSVEWVEKPRKDGTVRRYQRKCVIETPIKGLGFKPPEGSETKKEGVYQTNKGVLSQLKGRTKSQKRVIELLLDRSEVKKALETFIGQTPGAGLINKIMEDGCVHPKFNQTVTRTGRLSSSDPNGQNLPRKGTSPVKKIIISLLGKIGNADLSQLEYRVAAFLSQDPVMMDDILSGKDYHLENAIKFFGDAKYRTDAKTFGFRLLYGGTAYGMYMDPSMPRFSLKKWEKIVEEYHKKYSGLKRWQDENVRAVNKHGFLRLPSGRILTFDKKMQKDGTMGYSRRDILNYPVQSFATADIMGLAMTIIKARMRAKKVKSKVICQVHDSLVFDALREEINLIAHICINTFERLPEYMRRVWKINFNLPMGGEFEIGDSYGDLTVYKQAA